MEERKRDHIRLCLSGEFESGQTGFDRYRLVPESFPEGSAADVDPSVEFLGRRLAFPFLIGSMSGGTGEEREVQLNRVLARAAQEALVGLGLGSFRPLLEGDRHLPEYDVRDDMPDVPLLGNISAWQIRDPAVRGRVCELASRLRLDGMFVHVNAAQELVQPEGERDFSGALEAVRRFAGEYPGPVFIKEVGYGFASRHLETLVKSGIAGFDVAGRGGTDFVRVEAARCGSGEAGDLAGRLDVLGLPTAESVVRLRAELDPLLAPRKRKPVLVASGGIRTAADGALALALGADLFGMARPVLLWAEDGGKEEVTGNLAGIERDLKALMLLSGCRTLRGLAGKAVRIS